MSKQFGYKFFIKDSSGNILFKGNAPECADYMNVCRNAVYEAANKERKCNGYIVEYDKTEEMNPDQMTSGTKKIPDALLQEWEEVCSKFRGAKNEQ